jgi:hypothetical protein
VALPREPLPGPQRDPFEELTEEERARAKRTLLHRFQAGGIVFLAVVVLGLLPAAIAKVAPELGRAAAVAVWFVAPVLGVGLLVFALLRLRR